MGIKMVLKRPKVSIRHRPLLVSIFLITLIMLSSSPVDALVKTVYVTASTATVKTPSVTLASGLAGVGSSSVFGGTYASATVTAGLTFNVNAAPTVSTLVAPSLDGVAVTAIGSGSSTPQTNIVTNNANEIIYVVIAILGGSAIVSDVHSVTLQGSPRGANSDGSQRVETWYIPAASTGTYGITVEFSASATYYVTMFAIRDVNFANPFDGSPTLVAQNQGSGRSQSVTVSTLNPNDFIIGALAASVTNGNAPIPNAQNTNIKTGRTGRLASGAEYLSVTSIQNGVTLSFTTLRSVTWVMVGDAVQRVLPTASSNTALSTPGAGSSVSVGNGVSAFLWSPVYSTTTTIYAGSWLMDIWARSATSDTMSVVVAQVDSLNTITSIVASGTTTTIGTTKSEFVTAFACSQITVASGNRLLVIFTNLAGGSSTFTIYWGTGQMTNFKTPSLYDYVLSVTNTATSPYTMSFSTSSNPSLSRLTTLNFYVYSPTTNCIVVTNGALTQSSSSTITLAASSTMYIAVDTKANDFGSSSLSIQLQFSPNSNMHPFTNLQIDLTVN